MTNTELIEGFFAAVGSGDIGALSPLLADDFVYEDQTVPAPMSKDQFLGWINSLAVAVPDLSLDVHGITAVGDEVVADMALAGTVSGDLDLAALGQGVIPASGTTIALAHQALSFTFIGNAIAGCVAEAAPGAGIGAIIEEIGGLATAPV